MVTTERPALRRAPERRLTRGQTGLPCRRQACAARRPDAGIARFSRLDRFRSLHAGCRRTPRGEHERVGPLATVGRRSGQSLIGVCGDLHGHLQLAACAWAIEQRDSGRRLAAILAYGGSARSRTTRSSRAPRHGTVQRTPASSSLRSGQPIPRRRGLTGSTPRGRRADWASLPRSSWCTAITRASITSLPF